jgi:hypothetical protein
MQLSLPQTRLCVCKAGYTWYSAKGLLHIQLEVGSILDQPSLQLHESRRVMWELYIQLKVFCKRRALILQTSFSWPWRCSVVLLGHLSRQCWRINVVPMVSHVVGYASSHYIDWIESITLMNLYLNCCVELKVI